MSTITAQEYCLITFSDLNGLFPQGFTDKIYLENRRPVKIGVYKESFVTSEKHNLIYDSTNYRNRLIQAIVYDKYRIEWIKTESSPAELIEFADSITVYSYGNKMQYEPVILDVSTEKVPGSEFDKITIEFYDKRKENYLYQQPVINVLRSDQLLNRKDISQLNRVMIQTPSTSYNWYTAFYMVEKETDPENLSEDEINGLKITTRVTTRTQKEIMLFLNDSDLQLFKELAAKCGELAGTTYTHYLKVYESGTYTTAIERPTFEVETIAGAVQLHKVTIKLTTEINNTFKYQ